MTIKHLHDGEPAGDPAFDLGDVLKLGRHAPDAPVRPSRSTLVTDLVARSRAEFPPECNAPWYAKTRNMLMELPLSPIEVDAVMGVIVTILDGCPVHGYGPMPHGPAHEMHRAYAAVRNCDVEHDPAVDLDAIINEDDAP